MIEKAIGNANWMGEDLQNSDAWIVHFEDADLAEIDAGLAHVRDAGITLETSTKGDFPFVRVAEKLDAMRDAIESGPGLHLLRGLPMDRYSVDEARMIYWAFGLHAGTAVSQSRRGDVLGDVRNIGTGLDGPKFRGYTSNGELTYHSDAADVSGLFCLKGAKSGGISRLVSALAIHDELLRTRPDLLETLYQPYYWSWQGNEADDEKPYYQQPIFAVQDGKIACRYTRTHIRSAEMMDDLADLTAEQNAALDAIDAICERPEFQLEFILQAGDILFFNNHLTLHMRTEFEDFEELERKRHLLRLWLSVPNSRSLAPGFGEFYRDTSGGAVRGGFPSDGGPPVFTTL